MNKFKSTSEQWDKIRAATDTFEHPVTERDRTEIEATCLAFIQ